MDEVDIDNVEDRNELESCLYSQIHHEATNIPVVEIAEQRKGNDNIQANNTRNYNDTILNGGICETSSHTNKILSRRYWSGGQNSSQQEHRPQQHQGSTKQDFTHNPFKTSYQENRQKTNNFTICSKSRNQQPSKQIKNYAVNKPASVVTKEHPTTKQDNTEKLNTMTIDRSTNISSSASTVEHTPTRKDSVAVSTSNEKKNKNIHTKTDQSEKQKLPTTPAAKRTNLKLNPVVDWMKRNKQQTNKKVNNNYKNVQKNNNVNLKNLKAAAVNSMEGPFVKQQQKLQRAKRLEDKKQKSKKVKSTAATVASEIKPTAVIDLVSDNESDSSDVILVPIPPPPTFTLEDSADEDDKDNTPLMLEREENTLDSTDEQMLSTSSRFIKPQQINAQSSGSIEGDEKRLDTPSHCPSPCSIQSSDDFIGQSDRKRLLTGSSGLADDEDLLMLTSDVNSLLEAPQSVKQTVNNENVSNKEMNLLNSTFKKVNQNMETNDSLEFATSKTSNPQERTKDYRVEQSQFRALDVYESESDITDNVYSKGANKSTVIRKIDTSSDEVEDIGSCNQKTKRLRKHRASSSNKEFNACNENSAPSSDDENSDDNAADYDNELLRTPIPFIARGVAVERCNPRKRSRTLSSRSPITPKRKSAKDSVSSSHMSDTAFIATLNNLANGQEEGNHEMEEDESETENIPTARDIAEKILGQHIERSKQAEDIALPEDVLNELDRVFETIDHMDKHGKQITQSSTPEYALQISDSSDSDIEKRLTYKSLPNDDTQIIEYSPNLPKSGRTGKTHAENGSPIYNIIYSRGQRKPGGLGWNDEMRKFYNDSWNGEHFIMSKVLQKMNPDKNLWKIYREDRFNIKFNKIRNNLKCTNCCEFGHLRSKCRRPRKPMICYMCGDSGHHEPRCPNTICLRCGNKTEVFTKSCNACIYQNRILCPICKIRGHSLDFCPDKWRRYHSTTEPNANPNNNIYYNPRKYCCICGARGHLSESCRSGVRFMEYPAIVSTIKSHQKSYSDVPIKMSHNGVGFNLMYKPCQEYKFGLVERTSSNKYYGRFLKAVGLGFMLKHKQPIPATTEMVDTRTKKAKRSSNKYVANPYSKIGKANQQNTGPEEDAPNQVQEITESNYAVDLNEEEAVPDDGIINLEDNSAGTIDNDKDVELIDSTVNDVMGDIRLNTINETSLDENVEGSFKFPKNVVSSDETTSNLQTEPPVALDSDSNYSFSDHFDVPPKSVGVAAETINMQFIPLDEESTLLDNSRSKPRAMEALPDFIPLVDGCMNVYNDNVGTFKEFVDAESDEEINGRENARNPSLLPEMPCEAKIYLTNFHSKYLLSPVGNAFLAKTAKDHKLKTRLDFTSIGYVLIIFGLPSNQDKFQKELLLKYRELDENNQKQSQSNLNIPKRADVLIRFLRDNITQLLSNLGNVNYLLKRLNFLERQQSKSGYKLAEKVRRSLNMILIGQAGLKNGNMHLDKLLSSLKTLMNDYNSDDVTSPQLRSEITDHWKVIFSPYRHENYQQLVDSYNKLISKNRMPKLIIDPILLGQKVIDTSFNEEQKLAQTRTPAILNETSNVEPAKLIVPNPLCQKKLKVAKCKQNSAVSNISLSDPTSVAAPSTKTIPSIQVDNISYSTNVQTETISTLTCNGSESSIPPKPKTPVDISTPSKIKTSISTIATNKSKSTGITITPTSTTESEKEAQKNNISTTFC